MIAQRSVLVAMVMLIDQIPTLPPPTRRQRGRPLIYPDCLFLKALVIMSYATCTELLTMLNEPSDEMMALRAVLVVNDRLPTRRTWERHLHAIPDQLPAQIGCLGRSLVQLIQP